MIQKQSLVRILFNGFAGMLLVFVIFTPACSSDDDEADPDCNIENITYSQVVAPVMATYCNSCHSGAAPNAGVTTSNYAGLSTVALSGRLLGSINHESGFSNMPEGQPQLPACTRQQIAAWIEAGAPNN